MTIETRDDLKAALTFFDDTMGTISRKLDWVAWTDLRPIEQSLYLHGLRVQMRRTGGRLVRSQGRPIVWTAFDDQVHGGCRLQAWVA